MKLKYDQLYKGKQVNIMSLFQNFSRILYNFIIIETLLQ